LWTSLPISPIRQYSCVDICTAFPNQIIHFLDMYRFSQSDSTLLWTSVSIFPVKQYHFVDKGKVEVSLVHAV
jgi:hypothetical protein